MIQGHGDDLYLYPEGEVKINFSSNIPAHADLSDLKQYLASQLDCIGSYPEPEPYALERLIAEKEGIDPQCVSVTNGATEAIYLLAQAFRGNKSTIIQPTFSEYAAACRIHRHKIGERGDIVWLCNPNNPTGRVMDRDELAALVANPDVLYIIDQAYEDYTSEPLLTDGEAVALQNVALIHSMTKQYCVPGLRLGYVVAEAPICDRIREVRQPWSVNALAIKAGMYLVTHRHPASPTDLLQRAQRLWQGLNAIEGVEMMPTLTHFMLGSVSKGTALQMKLWLIAHHGILIRDASNFEGLSPRHFRVAAQSEEENDRLVAAVKEYFERYKAQDICI